MRWRLTRALLAAAGVVCASPGHASAHLVVAPANSPTGATQRYAIQVPAEKPVPTVRLEVQFPSELRVTELQAVPGWRVTGLKDASGRIVRAVWEEGSIPPGQFAEFGVLGTNPSAPGDLVWRMIQTYADRSETHWIGPSGAEFPAPVTRVRPAGPGFGASELLAGAAAMVSLVAVVLAGLAWRRAGQAPRHPPGP